MRGNGTGRRLERAVLARLVSAIVAVAFTVAGLNLLGWATGIQVLTRLLPFSLDMTLWTALILVGLGMALLLQSGQPPRSRVWAGRSLAVIAGVWAIPFLTGHPIGGSASGGPSPSAAASLVLLSIAVALIRADQPWTQGLWSLCFAIAVTIPVVTGLAHLVGVIPLADQAIVSGVGLLILFAAIVAARPDRFTVGWLLNGPERWVPVRLASVFVVLPITVGLLRWVLLELGVRTETERVTSIVLGVSVFAGIAFLILKREQGLQSKNEQLDSKRAAAETRYRQLADNAIDIIVHLRGTEIIWISPSVESAFGWPIEHWVGTNCTRVFRLDDLELATSWLQTAEHDNASGRRFQVAASDGKYHWVESRGKPFIDDKGKADGLIITIRAVDEQVEAEQLLDAQRQRFEAVVANSPSAISVCDLQLRYTLVNRAFCQLFGQKSAADVIGRTKDEVLPPDALASSRVAADRILAGERFFEYESITLGRENFLLVTQQFPLHNSTGAITEMVTVRTDITHRRNAEQAAIERATWEERIRAAIGTERLLIYSQPIVDIATRETIEEELLIRLRDSETDEVLLPGAFLPQCQQHGLMPVIDQYMVGRAIELAGSGRRVCVNITGQTIGTPTVMQEIIDALVAAGPDKTEKILFEITETTALGSPEVAGAFSRSMKSVGCRVALDDFGTGYGTFTELRHLELDSVKIDQSFVKSLLVEGGDERVVNSIILVARLYKLTTVAEGVESQAVLERLAKLGVDRAQGYLFGRPKPVD